MSRLFAGFIDRRRARVAIDMERRLAEYNYEQEARMAAAEWAQLTEGRESLAFTPVESWYPRRSPMEDRAC